MKATEHSITNKCPAVILAGGKSRRMGRDKAMLMVNGSTLLERAAESLRDYFDPIYISVNEKRDDLPADCIEIADRFPGSGPMAGLESAFARCEADCIFICAVDLPFLDGKAAHKMVTLLDGHDACVIKRDNGHIEPLFAVYSKKCHKAAVELLKGGNNKMASLLEKCTVRYVSLAQAGICESVLTNVNTPEEFEEATKHLV